jgi:hypothetical protein
MFQCPSCACRLPNDRERLGARCPNCRDPLYERESRGGRDARPGEPVCATHPGNAARGTCERCGNPLCAVCRTPWRDHWLCVACVERALAANEAGIGPHRSGYRQALAAVFLGAIAWALTLFVQFFGYRAGEGQQTILPIANALLLATATLTALVAVGNALAVLHSRSSPRRLAILGLLLGGLQVGVVLSLFLLAL